MGTALMPTKSRLAGPAGPDNVADVEIAVPVFNERVALEGSILRLHGLLSSEFPLSWRIVIVDKSSTDGTRAIARRLSYELNGVEAVHRRRAPSAPRTLAMPSRPLLAP
jgi:glycosyltransferase involved in cell wall biosynthesis